MYILIIILNLIFVTISSLFYTSIDFIRAIEPNIVFKNVNGAVNSDINIRNS